MLATNGPDWFDRRRPDHTGPSIVVAVGITLALFASAFVAMQRIGRWTDSRTSVAPAVVVRLTPPPVAPQRRLPRHAAPPVNRPTPSVSPTVAPPTTSAAPVTGDHVNGLAVDTATGVAKSPAIIPHGISPIQHAGVDTGLGSRAGATDQQSGVTIGSRTANTAAFRDSVGAAKMKDIPWLAATHAPKGRELAELRSSQRAALGGFRRSTTAGNADIHVMQGEGMGGEGAAGGNPAAHGGSGVGLGSSVGLSLFSSGPSAAQRKKNEAIEAAYQLGLRRLEDRILLRRDSLRADSLRRDSLRRASVRRDSLTR